MEVVIQFIDTTENSLDVLNDPQLSWKYVENMYYMNTVTPFLLKCILSGLTLNEGGGGLIGNLASFCQNAPINMQKHFLGSVIVSASSKLGKTASQHGRH